MEGCNPGGNFLVTYLGDGDVLPRRQYLVPQDGVVHDSGRVADLDLAGQPLLRVLPDGDLTAFRVGPLTPVELG